MTLAIPFPTFEGASITLQALLVDDAIGDTTRDLHIQGGSKTTLRAVLKSTNKRALRTAAHSLLEQMSLASMTLDTFAVTSLTGSRSGLLPSPAMRPLSSLTGEVAALPPL